MIKLFQLSFCILIAIISSSQAYTEAGNSGSQIIHTGPIPADGFDHTYTWTNNTGFFIQIFKAEIINYADAGTVNQFWSYLEIVSTGALLAIGEGSGDGSRIFTNEGNNYSQVISPGEQIQLRVNVSSTHNVREQPQAVCAAAIWYEQLTNP